MYIYIYIYIAVAYSYASPIYARVPPAIFIRRIYSFIYILRCVRLHRVVYALGRSSSASDRLHLAAVIFFFSIASCRSAESGLRCAKG